MVLERKFGAVDNFMLSDCVVLLKNGVPHWRGGYEDRRRKKGELNRRVAEDAEE